MTMTTNIADDRFSRNKYYRWYLSITAIPDRAEYTENHHIVPRSLGGNNASTNLVRLSARKHFLCHWLLTKFTAGNDCRKMLWALGFMTARQKKIMPSWKYQIAREASGLARKGMPSPMKGKVTSPEVREKQSLAKRGKKLTQEHVAKLIGKTKGRKYPNRKRPHDECRQKVSASLMGNKRCVGRVNSEETRRKMSAAHHANVSTLANNRSGLRGVEKRSNRYLSFTSIHKRRVYLGSFDCPAAAHFAYLVRVDTISKQCPKET